MHTLWGDELNDSVAHFLKVTPSDHRRKLLPNISASDIHVRCGMVHPKCSSGHWKSPKMAKRCRNKIDCWIAILALIFQLNCAVTSPQQPLVPGVKTSHGPLLWRKSGALPVDIFQLKLPGGQFLFPSPSSALGALRRPCRPGAMDWQFLGDGLVIPSCSIVLHMGTQNE